MTTQAPDTTPLTRAEAAGFLTESGFAITRATLSWHACRGTGPAFARWGRVARYERAALLAWARGRATEPRAKSQPRRKAA